MFLARRIFFAGVISVALLAGNAENCSASSKGNQEITETVAQDGDEPKRVGYISEFLEMRSGERGVFGFIGWVLSQDLWQDFARFAELKFQQRIEALSAG